MYLASNDIKTSNTNLSVRVNKKLHIDISPLVREYFEIYIVLDNIKPVTSISPLENIAKFTVRVRKMKYTGNISYSLETVRMSI